MTLREEARAEVDRLIAELAAAQAKLAKATLDEAHENTRLERARFEEYAKLLPPADRSQQTLADGSPVTADHREIEPATGMQKG